MLDVSLVIERARLKFAVLVKGATTIQKMQCKIIRMNLVQLIEFNVKLEDSKRKTESGNLISKLIAFSVRISRRFSGLGPFFHTIHCMLPNIP